MPKISTYYDTSLHEKCFMIKGTEGYARTTDVILEELEKHGNYKESTENFKIALRINVLRDKGESKVALYNGDTLLKSWDWNDTLQSLELTYDEDNHTDTRIELPYFLDNDLYIKYLGNKECLPSQSTHLHFYEEPSEHYICNIISSLMNTTIPYPDDADDEKVIIPIEFVYDTNDGLRSDKTVDVYFDIDEENDKQSITLTSDENQKDVTFDEYDNYGIGLKKVRCVFNGDEHVISADVTFSIGVGYNITVTKYTEKVALGDSISIRGNIKDWFGNTVRNNLKLYRITQYKGQVYNDSNGQVYDRDYELIDTKDHTNGWVFSATPSIETSDDTFESYQLINANDNSKSLIIKPTVVKLNDIVLTSDKIIVSNGYSTSIGGSLSANTNPRGLPVKISLPARNTSYTVVANPINPSLQNQIVFQQQITGNGGGYSNIQVHCGTINKTIQLIDCLQYWSIKNGIQNQNYDILAGSLTKQSNGWKLNGLFTINESSEDYNCEFDIISSTGTVYLCVGEYYEKSLYNLRADTVSLKAGDHIKIISENGIIFVKKNNSTLFTVTHECYNQLALGIGGGAVVPNTVDVSTSQSISSSANVVFDNFMYMRN